MKLPNSFLVSILARKVEQRFLYVGRSWADSGHYYVESIFDSGPY